MNRLPLSGSHPLPALLDPCIPDDFLNTQCSVRPVRGPCWPFSPAQLWRTRRLALLTPAPSFNLLARLLPEQGAGRPFARRHHRPGTPDVRLRNAFRARLGVQGLRQINEAILPPLVRTAALGQNATALINATDLPAAGRGCKKRRRRLHRGPRRAGRAHAQDRAEPLVGRLQQAQLPPLVARVFAGGLAGAAG